MKRLYSCNAESVIFSETVFEIVEEKPRFFRAYPTQKLSLRNIAVNTYWWLVTLGKYRVWCALDNDKVVHTSYVIPKCSKFSFLNKGDYEIGPCKTNVEYRGRGIYPAVLYTIVSKGGTAYMIVDDNNQSSIRGVTKCGFLVMPGCVKRSKMRRYIYVKGDQ